MLAVPPPGKLAPQKPGRSTVPLKFTIRLLSLLAAVCISCSPGGRAGGGIPEGVEVVDLSPLEQAAWTPRNVFAGITSLLGAWNHWYGDKEILIETVPSGAYLSLYYLRSNFQKLFERSNLGCQKCNLVDCSAVLLL